MYIEELPFSVVYPLIEKMTLDHHEEVSLVKDVLELDVDVEYYHMLEKMKRVLCFVAKEGDEVVGYAIFFTSPSHHRFKSKSLVSNDVLYLATAHRKGMAGVRFIRQLNDVLKNRFDIIAWHVKDSHDFSPILKRQGFIKQDTYYSYVGE